VRPRAKYETERNDEAFQWMAYEPHHAWLAWVLIEPWTADKIRNDPRLKEFMKRLNLPEEK
jgi:hypothetical protein